MISGAVVGEFGHSEGLNSERWLIYTGPVNRSLGDVTEVQSNGSGTVVAPLEFFQHALSEWGHHNAS
jgi:hypothetical protein